MPLFPVPFSAKTLLRHTGAFTVAGFVMSGLCHDRRRDRAIERVVIGKSGPVHDVDRLDAVLKAQ